MNKNKNALKVLKGGTKRIRLKGNKIAYDFLRKIRKQIPPDIQPLEVTWDKATGKGVPYGVSIKNEKMRKALEKDMILKRLMENSDIVVATLVINQGIIGRNITVGTTPVRVVRSQFLRGYIIMNPTPSVGLTTSGTVLASATRSASASGNTQSNPIGTASYREMKLFLDISASGGGIVTVNAQSKDPLSGNWVTTQSDVFGSSSAVGTYYADLGSLGIDTDFAISWSVSSAGSSTFSIGYVLKDGLSGSSAGLSNTVYLGGPGVTTVSGFPLLEGDNLKLFFRPNAELWAVSGISGGISLRVFEL